MPDPCVQRQIPTMRHCLKIETHLSYEDVNPTRVALYETNSLQPYSLLQQWERPSRHRGPEPCVTLNDSQGQAVIPRVPFSLRTMSIHDKQTPPGHFEHRKSHHSTIQSLTE